MRDRLIKLLYKCEEIDHAKGVNGYDSDESIVDTADYLLANGVIVPPCKVEDTVYYLGGLYSCLVKSATVVEIILNFKGVSDLLVTSENGVTFENSIETFFLTRKEAEAALKGGAE